jgi:hypothetical protein
VFEDKPHRIPILPMSCQCTLSWTAHAIVNGDIEMMNTYRRRLASEVLGGCGTLTMHEVSGRFESKATLQTL